MQTRVEDHNLLLFLAIHSQTGEVEVGCEQELRLGDDIDTGRSVGICRGGRRHLRLDPETLRLRPARYIRVQVRVLQFG